MIFVGPLSNPVTLGIPGLVDPGTPIANRCLWGEEFKISIPDPGFDCSIHLVIKSRGDQAEPDLVKTYERTDNVGDIVITISGAESIEKLAPGSFVLQCLYVVSGGDAEGERRFGPQTTIELSEGAASSYDPQVQE
jgi:hypothetical protein